MAVVFGRRVLRVMIPDLYKSKLSGTRALAAFRKIGGSISNESFWADWREITGFVRNEPIARDWPLTRQLPTTAFIKKARPVGKKYNFRYQVDVYDPFLERHSKRTFSASTNRRMSPQEAFNELWDAMQTGDSEYDLQLVNMSFIGGLIR